MFELTDRQKMLLLACINAELENSHQGDTSLSLSVTENAEDPDTAGDSLRAELCALAKLLRGGD